MKCILYFFTGCLSSFTVYAQTTEFKTAGKIEYEVKFNQRKSFIEMYGEQSSYNNFLSNLPDFDIYYYNLNFSNTSSLYAPGKPSGSPTPDKGAVYIENSTHKFVARKNIFNTNYLYTDTLKDIKWRIQNETRKIAGFECRKAVGRLPGDVYIVAFYTLEIMPQAGPELFSGLPGMILGAAVPQWHITWFATKIELTDIYETAIKAPQSGKEKTYNKPQLSELLHKNYSGYYNEHLNRTKMDSIFLNSYKL